MWQNKTGFVIMYFALALIMLVIEYVDWSTGRYIVKPLLMLTLIAYLINVQVPIQQRKLIILALIFSCLGDSMLMFPSCQMCLTGGTLSFLLAHIFYIIIFYRDIKLNINHMQKSGLASLGAIIFVFSYTAIFYSLIKNDLGEMQIPSMVYMVIISIMVIMAFIRRIAVDKYSFICVFLGSILFVISDSLFSINQFVIKVSELNILIILTYILAQFFIIHGLIRTKN